MPTPSPRPPACVQPVARAIAPGVSSADPVLLLASGLNVPDDLLYTDDGTVLVGEHGDGHIARVGGAEGLVRLPQVVPEAEGIVQLDGVTYVADQQNARVVALTDTGLRTLIQLQPVASGENLDGISAAPFGGLAVPDSPHGTLLFVDAAGHITRTVGGFRRPAGASIEALPSGAGLLIADENSSAVYELTGLNGGPVRIAGNLPGVDDAIRTNGGHLLAILPAAGRLVDVTAGANLATGLQTPQGLGFDGAQNVLVTESDNGRLDLVVTTFAISVPSGIVQLSPGQGVCYGILRAPGNTDPIRVFESIGAVPLDDPSVGTQGEVVPGVCNLPPCAVTLVLQGPSGLEYAHFSYRD